MDTVALGAVEVNEGVRAVVRLEVEEIGAAAALQGIVVVPLGRTARSAGAVQEIVALAAGQEVVAVRGGQGVIACSAGQAPASVRAPP